MRIELREHRRTVMAKESLSRLIHEGQIAFCFKVSYVSLYFQERCLFFRPFPLSDFPLGLSLLLLVVMLSSRKSYNAVSSQIHSQQLPSYLAACFPADQRYRIVRGSLVCVPRLSVFSKSNVQHLRLFSSCLHTVAIILQLSLPSLEKRIVLGI